MAYCQGRDFLFCSLCGSLLSFDSVDYAKCHLCGFKCSAAEIRGREISYTMTSEDIRRELQLEPFVVLGTASMDEEMVQRAIVNQSCPRCNNPELQYYTRQLRSADEGQTIFYECAKCGHKYAENT